MGPCLFVVFRGRVLAGGVESHVVERANHHYTEGGGARQLNAEEPPLTGLLGPPSKGGRSYKKRTRSHHSDSNLRRPF
jgi:hypothetical protein